jgi:heptosyltransferase-2
MKIKKILVIRFRRVGDAVLSSVLCSSLRKIFPEATIDYVLNDGIAPLFENHADIDCIITFSHTDMEKLPVYLKKVRHIMKTGQYDLIVDTRSTIKTLWFSLFSLHTSFRIGKKKAYNAGLHNYRVDNEGVVDEITKTLLLLRPLEKFYPVTYNRNFKIYLLPEEKKTFAGYMEKQGILFSKPVITCAVTARLIHKIWNQKRMQEVLWKIIRQYDAQLIFNYGGKEEEAYAKQMHAEMQNHPNIFTNIEARNLRELAAMLSLSDFFFGNEGGPRHISQALDIPSFAIYPPGISKEEWLPNASCRFQGVSPSELSAKANDENVSYEEKFDLITVEEVWTRLSPMLEDFLSFRHE